MDGKVYNLKFGHFKIDPGQLKETEINQMIWILSMSRHARDISFDSYGYVEFDELDTGHWNPIVTLLNGYRKRHCEVAVFDLHPKDGNGQFNKMFVYKICRRNMPNWGYVLYNEETKEMKDKYFIPGDMNDIILEINRVLNHMQWNITHRMDDIERSLKENINKSVREYWTTSNERMIKIYDDLPNVYNKVG